MLKQSTLIGKRKWLGTANHSALFQIGIATYATQKFVYDIGSWLL